MDYDTVLTYLEKIEQWAWSESEAAKAAEDEDRASAYDTMADCASDAQSFARSHLSSYAYASE